MTDLVNVVYEAYRRKPPTQDVISKQVQRFKKLESIIPELIEESTDERTKSGKLKKDLLAYYPGQILPKPGTPPAP